MDKQVGQPDKVTPTSEATVRRAIRNSTAGVGERESYGAYSGITETCECSSQANL